MADAKEIMAELVKVNSDTRFPVLIPNLKGKKGWR